MTWVLGTAYGLLESIGYRPRELYTFARNDQVWRMTAGTSLLAAIAGRVGIAYAPGLVTRDAISRTDESRSQTITVRVARTTAVADALREVHRAPMTLRIERWQDTTDSSPVPIVLAQGDVANVRVTGGWIEFALDTGEGIFDLPFPSRLISRQNQWPTYSPFTGVTEDDFSFETTVAALTRSTITVAAKAPDTADGYYDGGMIRVGAIGAHGEPMFVRFSSGLDFHVNGRVLSGLAVGDTVTLVAGDDRALTTARDKFGPQAVRRFLGFDLLPTTDVLQTGLHDTPIYRSPYTTPTGTAPGTPIAGVPAGLTVSQSAVETPDSVSVLLDVDDPDAIIVRVEVRSNVSGFAGDWTAFAAIDPTTLGGTHYQIDRAKSPAGFVAIDVRVAYIDPDDHTEHTQTLALQYTSGLTHEQTLTQGTLSGGLVANVVLLSEPIGVIEERIYVALTHDGYLLLDGGGHFFDRGYRAVFSIDARGGPFTLTLGTVPNVGVSIPPPVTDPVYYNGAPVTALTLNGLVYLELLVDGGWGFQLRTLP